MTAPYAQIAEAIRQRIATGALRDGDLVPSARQITREFGVALATATKVLAALRTDGLVRPVPGVGTVVVARAAASTVAPSGSPAASSGVAPGVARAGSPAGSSGVGSSGVGSSGVGSSGVAPAASTAGSSGVAPGVAPSGSPADSSTRSPTVSSGASPAAALPPRARHPRANEHDLTRERIVRAAIAVAAEEGLGGLSMRRIATELGAATMSLYRHVPNKDELVLLMADTVFADTPPPAERPPGWRAQLEALARLQWSAYQRHPWVASVISMTRPQLLPHGVAHTEWAMKAVDDLGLDPGTQLHVVVTLFSYVRGTATNIEPQARTVQDTGVTDAEWMNAHDDEFTAYFLDGPYPTLARLSLLDRDSDTPASLNLDSLFEFGLASLLDGYAVRFG